MRLSNQEGGMHLTDAAKSLHAYILEGFPEGLPKGQLAHFYAFDPSAGERIQQRRLNRVLKQYSHLFAVEEDDDGNGDLIRARLNRNHKKTVESDRKRLQRIAVQFYNDCLKGKQLVIKRCEDRNQFTQELYKWKDSRRQYITKHGNGSANANKELRGVSPSAIINALKTKRLISDIFQGNIILWNEASENGHGHGNGSKRKSMTRKERIEEALQRVREAQQVLQKNRKGIVVDAITFGVAEGDVTRPHDEVSQTVWIRNSSTRAAVRVKVQGEIAKRRGFQIEEQGRSGSTTLNIAPGSRCSVEVKFTPTSIGVVRTMIPFDFECCAEPPYFTPFTIARYITLRCGDPEDHAILKPTAPYQRKKMIDSRAFRNAEYVEKDRRTALPNKFVRPLLQYRIPDHVEEAIKSKNIEEEISSILYMDETPPEELPSDIMSKLHFQNYGPFFQTLLWVEEYQMSIDIRNYDLENVPLQRRGRLYSLVVPGLAEARPSVLRGDKIYISHNKSKCFAADVTMIECESVIVMINKKFDHLFVEGMKFDVRFDYSRTALRVCHQAVQKMGPRNKLFGEILFPDGSKTKRPLNVPKRVNFYNRDLNREQKAAVLGVLAAASRPSPYLIFGPPGTGKTVTLVESIAQTAKADPSCKILVCAPSNAATDLIVERLAPYFTKAELIRLLAYTREKRDVPQAVMPFTHFDEYENAFVTPSPDEVKQKRIVVVTLGSGGKLPNEGIMNHFTHVFMDEAGHAIEPLALGCLAELTIGRKGGESPVFVLAGDPKQLGPIVRSQVGKDFGLDKSFLERLCELSPYQRSESQQGHYDSRMMAKLVRNYRSHPAILKLPNERFYDGDLVASADVFTINSLKTWEHLPRKGFPLIFHGVQGRDEREGNSPSWYNAEEVQLVKEYVTLLVSGTRSNRVKPEEIAVITPYSKQAQKIRMLLRSHNYGDIKVGSVDEFQGSERRVVIISTVRSSVEYMDYDNRYQLGFLSNAKRFNVAITRAKALLVVIGNPFVLERDGDWDAFVRHVVDNGGYTGVDFQPGKNEGKDYDEGIDNAVKGIAGMSMQAEDEDDSSDDDGFAMISQTTAQEGPAWRTEE